MRYSQYIKSLELQLYRAKAREMPHENRFWSEQEEWPIDGPTSVFLARAVAVLGENRFGMAWQGIEYAGAVRPFLRSGFREQSTPGEVAWVCKFLHSTSHGRPDTISEDEVALLDQAEPDEAVKWLAYEIACYRLSDHDWDLAADEYDEVHEDGPNMAIQWDLVLSELHRSMLDGTLKTMFRAREGGEVKLGSPDVWNTEKWRSRFKSCSINPDSPFKDHVSGSTWDNDSNSIKCSLIFVDRMGLNALIRNARSAVSAKSNDYASPHLQMMQKVSRDLRLNSETPPPRLDAIVDALRRAWQEGPHRQLPIGGDAFLRSLAKALKEPGTQARRNSPQP